MKSPSSGMCKIPEAQRPHPEGPLYCIVLTQAGVPMLIVNTGIL
jgi:hypothetical protein